MLFAAALQVREPTTDRLPTDKRRAFSVLKLALDDRLPERTKLLVNAGGDDVDRGTVVRRRRCDAMLLVHAVIPIRRPA